MSPRRAVAALRRSCLIVPVALLLSSLAGQASATTHPAPSGPDDARRALELGRYLHASLIMRDHLAGVRDSTPEDLLLAARAEGGWGNWERVTRLLAGRPWLDTLGGGAGWDLLGQAYSGLERWTDSRNAWRKYVALVPATDARNRGIAELNRAAAHSRAGESADALAAFAAARGLLPPIADWITIEAAGAAATAADTAAVRTLLAAADAEVAREFGWKHRVNGFRKAGSPRLALAAAEAAAAEPGSAGMRAAAWAEAGLLRNTLGDAAGAREAFSRAMSAAPGTTAAVDAARNLSEMDGITASDRLQIGRVFLRHGNLARGISGLQAYINAGAGSAAEREQLRWDLGQAQFRAARYDDAEKTLLGIVSRASGSSPSLAADALFYAARSQYRDGRVTLARRTFLDVARQFPGQAGAARALYIAADLDHDDGETTRAAERFRQAIATGADVEEVGLAYMRIANMAYQQRDFGGALREFDGYRNRYPTGRRYVQAAYWAGLSAARLGDTATARLRFEEVRRMDPFSYYGGRAADLLGRTFWDVPLGAAPVSSTAETDAVARDMARIDLLHTLGWTEATRFEIERSKQRFTGSTGTAYSFAEALNERGFAMSGIAIGWDLFRRGGGWNPRLLRIIYPFPFQNILIEEAHESGVDPFLAAGLIRQESMFNPEAVSPAGAVGLMQVMPATGRTLAGRLGVRTFDENMLKHAEFNAHLGMAYLHDQLDAFGGRLPVVLAAYNAGPHRITRWREFPEFADDETFSERIPFAETRDYVKIVQNNARIYAALYGPLAQAGPAR